MKVWDLRHSYSRSKKLPRPWLQFDSTGKGSISLTIKLLCYILLNRLHVTDS